MEPTLTDIEDYYGKESKEKRNTINLVIGGLVIVAAIYGAVKFYYQSQPLNIYIEQKN